MRLWEHDYGILRKWRRESKLPTFLAVVLTNLGHEFRNKSGGRWRASAAARRSGRLAIQLERLLHLHGMRLDEAAEWLRSRGETTLSDRELAALRAQLPERVRPRHVVDDADVLDRLPDEGATADGRLLGQEADAARREAHRALHAALARLTPLEQVVVRMYYLDGQTLADVARALGVEQKPLYRTKDAAVRSLKRYLVEGGMTPETLRGLVDGSLSEPDGYADTSGRDDAEGSVDGVGANGVRVTRDTDTGRPHGKSGAVGPSNTEWEPHGMNAIDRDRDTLPEA
jgi:RNA polymerase sigma factor for flagellar operon FliA